jgi:hypothetical protein
VLLGYVKERRGRVCARRPPSIGRRVLVFGPTYWHMGRIPLDASAPPRRLISACRATEMQSEPRGARALPRPSLCQISWPGACETRTERGRRRIPAGPPRRRCGSGCCRMCSASATMRSGPPGARPPEAPRWPIQRESACALACFTCTCEALDWSNWCQTADDRPVRQFVHRRGGRELGRLCKEGGDCDSSPPPQG